jgi:hypothetical protein
MVLRLISEVVAMCGHGVAPLQTDGGRRARAGITSPSDKLGQSIPKLLVLRGRETRGGREIGTS